MKIITPLWIEQLPQKLDEEVIKFFRRQEKLAETRLKELKKLNKILSL